MVLLRTIEGILTLLILYACVTQLVIPLFRGTAILPFLRREKKLENELVELEQAHLEKSLDEKVRARRLALDENTKQGGTHD